MSARRLTALVSTAALLCCGLVARSAEAIRLHETLASGSTYRVHSRVELSGNLLVPPMGKEKAPRRLSVKGESSVEYDERVIDLAYGQVGKTLRIYQRLDFQRSVGDEPQKTALRSDVRRMVLLRTQHVEVPFSPDGPMTWAELDMVRTDVFTPALGGLLKEGEVRIGDEWQAGEQALRELTDLDEIKSGKLTCKLQEIAVRNGRRLARVGLNGTVSGVNEDGPNRQQLDGYFFFDLVSNHLSYLYLDGISWMIDKEGKTTGKIEGRYVLTRRLDAGNPGLLDGAIRNLVLEPNDDNTPLLFDEPALGVRFTYPRRWSVQRADARQITLQEPRGGGLQLTLEPPTHIPTANQVQAEAQAWLKKEGARTVRSTPPRRIGNDRSSIEQFEMDIEQGRDRWRLDYYVARQVAGGVTAAGRYPIAEAGSLQKDAERIMRSIELTPPKK